MKGCIRLVVVVSVLGACSVEPPGHDEGDTEQDLIVASGNPRAPCPRGTSQCVDMYFSNHEDDDLLFMNPDIEQSWRNTTTSRLPRYSYALQMFSSTFFGIQAIQAARRRA